METLSFLVAHSDQLRRLLQCNLAAQLAANTTAGTGDQDHLVGGRTGHQQWIRDDRIATEQIFDVQLLDIAQRNTPAGEVRQTWQGANMHRNRTQGFDDGVAPSPRYTGQGQQNVGDPPLLHQLCNLVGRIDHHAIDAAACLALIVVDKTD